MMAELVASKLGELWGAGCIGDSPGRMGKKEWGVGLSRD